MVAMPQDGRDYTKMETTTKQWGAIGILSLIVMALGGSIYLTPDQLDHAFICSTNQKIVIAERLSSTAKTAYWFEDSVEKSSVCTNGLWLNLKQYAKDNNLDINILLNNINEEVPSSELTGGLQYRCDSQKCEVIK